MAAALAGEAGEISGQGLGGRTIVGDIQDEHEQEEPDISRLPDGSYEFDGLVLLDDIIDILDIEFDEPEEDTIGGFVFGLLGRRPEVGDIVSTKGFKFEVLRAAGFRVERVKVTHSDSESVEKTENE